jgi:hypothetical protein
VTATFDAVVFGNHVAIGADSSGLFRKYSCDVVGHNGLQPAVLDTEVSVSPEGRPAFEALEAILKSVQKQTGHRIGLGLAPTNMLMQCTISQPFTNERARSAIRETLNLCHADLVWQFLYDANRYLLNLDAADSSIFLNALDPFWPAE